MKQYYVMLVTSMQRVIRQLESKTIHDFLFRVVERSPTKYLY